MDILPFTIKHKVRKLQIIVFLQPKRILNEYYRKLRVALCSKKV